MNAREVHTYVVISVFVYEHLAWGTMWYKIPHVRLLLIHPNQTSLNSC